MKRLASIFLLLLSVTVQSIGQSFSYGLDQSRDSMALVRIRARMDSIRMRRPTVGLVLCGGGAKGAAEIGAIRYLEEQGIPVDLVTGTSIGGLVGGFYAIGYNAAQMDSIMRNIDWSIALTDKVSRNYLSYSNYQYGQKFLISVPFYYSKDVYRRDHMEEVSHDGPHGRLHLGAEADTTKGASVWDNIRSSLPSGMASGQNVRNVFSSYTVGYQDDRGFWDFPRPFACVATEMVSGKPKVWFSGKLNTALRSTMSIPGLFTPVKVDGMVLVDGGMRNNYPVDIARDMGADYVIGIDLSDGYLDYSEINNIGDILAQGVNMLGREMYEKNVGDPDVSIKPDLKEYTMLSFDVASIDTMLRRGYEAAALAKDSLVALRKVVNPDSSAIHAFSNASDLSRRKVLVSNVEFSGIDAKEEAYLTRRLDVEPWTYVGKSEIEAAVATIYGTKAFDSVTYELLGSAEPYVLHFDCHKGPIHQFGIGLRADTDEMVSLLLNVGLNVHGIQGNALDFTGRLGANPYGKLHYYYMLSQGPTVNFATSVKYVDNNTLGIIGGDQEAEVKYINARNEVWFSNLRLRHHDIGFGIRSDYYGVKEALLSNSMETDVDTYGYETTNDMYYSLFYQSRTESFDDAYFPGKGVRFGLDGAWIFGAKDRSIEDFCTVQADFKTVIPFGRRLALLPFAAGRAIIGGGMIPVMYANIIGGRVAGRYLDQQIPFMGVTYAVGLPRTVVTGGAELRFRVSANNYFTAVAGFGDCAPGLDDLISDESRTFSGFGLEYAYDSILGPIRADVHWSSLTHRVGVYLSLGFDF